MTNTSREAICHECDHEILDFQSRHGVSLLLAFMEGFRKSQVRNRHVRCIRDTGYRKFLVSLSAMRKSNNQKADNVTSVWLLFGTSNEPFLYEMRCTVVKMVEEYGRASIRRAQFKLLNDGNPTTAIWLGKQYLGPAGPWRSP